MKPYSTTHLEEIERLKKAEGQIRGIIRMIEEHRYCVDILTQLAAVQGALTRIYENILERHLKSCVAESFEAGSLKDRTAKINEIITLLRHTRR